ncbi:hypothetical protein [Actinokineospora sp.]|uniref:hypothetical protein n=1 Tax=Actinokineospora sp. TaxID=1872133 RepID=UPI003D6B62B1
MKLYADHPARRARQMTADLLALLIVFATEVRERVLRLRAPGEGLVDAGGRLSGTFDSAATADDVPLGPDGHDLLALRALVTQPLSRLASAGPVGAGRRTGDPETVAGLATRELRKLGLHPPAS